MTLLSQLQSATEGSRKLSDDVIRLFGWRERYAHEGGILLPGMWVGPDGTQVYGPGRPDPTTNLQDAVSLVPEGWSWSASKIPNPDQPIGVVYSASLHNDGSYPPIWIKHEGSPCLALCIAIIKAHESKAEAERKQWCENMARLEGDAEIGAGLMARDPE